MAYRLESERLDPGQRRRDRAYAIASVVLAAIFTTALSTAGEPEENADPLDDDVLADTRKVDGRLSSEYTSPIRFSHGKHDSIECARCHADAASSEMASDDLLPTMEVCADCHGGNQASDEAPQPELRDCGGCHEGYAQSLDEPVEVREDWEDVTPPPLIPPRPQSRLRFDHSRHLDQLDNSADDESSGGETACGRCHGGSGDEPTMPTLETCSDCHSESSGSLKPTNHTVDWESRHGTVARAASSSCEDCHTEDDCADCHDEQAAAPFSVHPPNFDTLHAVDARAQLDDCSECHTIQTFCRQCHAEANFSPDPPDRPPARFKVHPPNWSDPNSPRNHGVMARRNIEDCASCHTERDCVSCHRGVNPHPPEFRLKCKQWLEANPTPCAKCHGNVGQLRSKCL